MRVDVKAWRRKYSIEDILNFDILPPIMHILVTKHLSYLPVAQRCLILSHLSCNLRCGIILGQEFFCRSLDRDGIICGVENLESETALLDCQVADLPKVTSIDITPCVALSRGWVVDICRKIPFVFMWFNHVADAEGINIIAEAAGEGASSFLSTDL